jgi:hypothetical protein
MSIYEARNIQYREYIDLGKSMRHFLPMAKARGLHAARIGEEYIRKSGVDVYL